MTATLQLTRTWAALTDRGKWQILIDPGSRHAAQHRA